MITIGRLSQRTGVNIETIRYYERTGILPKAQRAPNGRRIYGPSDVRRLQLVRQARGLGFEMKAVRALVDLQERPEAPCDEASVLTAELLATVNRRIRHLTAVRDDLARMRRTCLNRSVANCRIIASLLTAHN